MSKKTTDDIEERKDVFAWFGAAAYAAQCFEVELCILLLLVRRLEKPTSTLQELDKLDQELSSKTLGALLHQLEKHAVVHPDFKSMLNSYLDRRNYLMHHFFSDHSTDLSTSSGCQRMITELQDHCAALKEADDIAQCMSRNVRGHLGIAEDELERLAQAALRRSANA